MNLVEKTCGPCASGEPPMDAAAAQAMLNQLQGWHISDDGIAIEKGWKFKNFVQALDFVNRIGAEAEREGHHPDLAFGWGYVNVRLTTHESGGLQENDFILAAKIDAL